MTVWQLAPLGIVEPAVSGDAPAYSILTRRQGRR